MDSAMSLLFMSIKRRFNEQPKNHPFGIMSLFKIGVSRLSKSMSAGHFGDEAETQKVMSQKCIENMYFRTIFLRHKKR
jgi:hypothetical protein